MSYNLGSAEGHITMDYDGSGVGKARTDLTTLEKSGTSTRAALSKTATVMGGAGLAIAGGLALAVNSAASFEQRLSAIEAVSGATGDQMDAISDKALQLGKDTAFSATESASAMEELIKAGLSVDDVLNGAADATVNLAAAGEIDLPQAATIAANAMNQFNLSAKDMVGVADDIAGAANASAIDVSEFGQSLQQVGAVANLAGVSFHDTSVAIALLGNAGIKGSDAGTALKTMFSRLQPTTEKQANTMKDLGLITEDGTNKFYDQAGNLKDLSSVSGILQKSLKGMTAQQKQATLQTLFGSDAIRAAAILANEGSKGFDKLSKSMGKVSAADVAAKRMDNLRGQLEQLKGSLETAGIVLGSALLPAVKAITSGITVMLNAFLALPDGVQSVIAIVAAGLAVFLLFAAAAIKVGLAIQAAIPIITALGAAITGTMLIWLAVVVAIIAVAVALVILYKRSETFRNIVNAALAAVMQAAIALFNWFKANWMALAIIMLGPLGIAIVFIVKFWSQIVAAFKVGVAVVRAIWNTVGQDIINIVKAWLGGVIGVIKGALQIISGVVELFTAILKGDWKGAWEAIKKIVSGVLNIIKSIVKAWIGIVKGIFMAGWHAIQGVVTGAMHAIASVVKGAINTVVSIIKAGVSLAKSAWDTGIHALQAVVGPVMSAIKSAIQTGISTVTGILQSFADSSVFGAIEAAFNGIKTVIDAIKSAVEALSDAISNIPTPDIPDLPDLPSVNIPGVAKGGIVTRPTLLIAGEGGETEYIIPESKLAGFFSAGRNDLPHVPPMAPAGKHTTININNPEPERGSDSLISTSSQLGQIGLI